MATDEEIKQEIREILTENHVGKENAIYSGDIAEQVGVPDDDTHVRIREYLSELLEEGVPLASNPGHGYWIIKNQDELDNYVGSLERRARKIENRKIDVLDAAEEWPDLDLTDADEEFM
jgi:biotin operon repressor